MRAVGPNADRPRPIHRRIQPIMLDGAKHAAISGQGRSRGRGRPKADGGDGVIGEGQPATGSGKQQLYTRIKQSAGLYKSQCILRYQIHGIPRAL